MPATPRKATITFKEVTRDGLPFIEVTATGKFAASKKDSDTVEWGVVNLTNTDLDVAVIDFYAQAGGTPFADGTVPGFKTIPKKTTATTAGTGTLGPKVADGDETVFKYTILAKPTSATLWFLVRDPEMDIEP